jgi:replicative DNA helicase Mcm
MAPGILGHEAVKEAILLLLVGSPQTVLPDGTKLRGDMNVFLVGDPGVAKSEMLKFAAQVAPRGMFASGRGSTAAGLSAAVIREKNTLMLEAGVVVLADQGIACIDEFDKMKPEDRSALHEQMEQQTVTIAKGGIYATLNARTAILAASNPILGKYNPYQNLTDNITLPIPLLTRFDLIFVLRDTPTPGQDEKLATHILDVHRKRAYVDSPPIQFELLKKYIAFAKNYTPVLTMEAENRIKEYYLLLRRSATEGQIGATPRTLESLIRLASAKARLMLRDEVTDDDALTAISLMNKMVEDVLTDTETKTKGDFGILLGQPKGERGKLETLMNVLRDQEGPDRKPVEVKVFKQALMQTGKFGNEDEVDKLIQKAVRNGIIYEPKSGYIRKVQG